MTSTELADSPMVISLRRINAIQDRLASGEISAAKGLQLFMEMDGSDRLSALELVAEAYGGGDVINRNNQNVRVFAHSGVPVAHVEALLAGLYEEEVEELPARAA